MKQNIIYKGKYTNFIIRITMISSLLDTLALNTTFICRFNCCFVGLQYNYRWNSYQEFGFGAAISDSFLHKRQHHWSIDSCVMGNENLHLQSWSSPFKCQRNRFPSAVYCFHDCRIDYAVINLSAALNGSADCILTLHFHLLQYVQPPQWKVVVPGRIQAYPSYQRHLHALMKRWSHSLTKVLVSSDSYFWGSSSVWGRLIECARVDQFAWSTHWQQSFNDSWIDS